MSASAETPFWQLETFSSNTSLMAEEGSTRSYEGLAGDCDAFADRLRSRRGGGRGLGFILFAPTLESVGAYLGCLRSRAAVPLLVQAGVHPDLLDRLVAIYRPDWILIPRDREPPQGYSAQSPPRGSMQLLTADEPAGGDLHPDLALLLLTSGSTGSEKLVRLSYEALAANARSIAQYLRLRAEDCTITTLPLAYSFGMSILNSYLAAGASLILTSQSMMSRDFWSLAAGAGITSLSGVPSTFEMMRRAGLEKRGLTRLRTLTQAGGALRPELVRMFDQLARAQGWEMFVMYGQTEAAPRISYVPPERLNQKIGSIGIAIPGGELDIDPETSELLYSGPNVMMGYAETRGDLADGDRCGGVLRTGDLARRDSDGFFYITGRLKRFIKLSGSRINLDAVEARLGDAIRAQIACTGTDERLEVWLVDSAATRDEEVLHKLRDLFDIYPGLARVGRLERFPLNASGKIDYRALTSGRSQ